MLAQDFDSDHRRAQDEDQQSARLQRYQDEPGNRKTAGGTRFRPEMIYPPGTDRWNGKQCNFTGSSMGFIDPAFSR
jgi:hypothetical protein